MSDVDLPAIVAVAALEASRGRPLTKGSRTWVSWHNQNVHDDLPVCESLERYARRKLAGEFDRKPAPFAASAVGVAHFTGAHLAAVAADRRVDVGPVGSDVCALVAYAEPKEPL